MLAAGLALTSGLSTASAEEGDDGPRTVDPSINLTRVSGSDATDLTLKLSQGRWSSAASGPTVRVASAPPTAGAVVLARSDIPQEAAAAVPLSTAKNGPLLFTPASGIPSSITMAEIKRLLPKGSTVYMVGSFNGLAVDYMSRMGYRPVKLAGANYELTALAVARDGIGNPQEILFTSGENPVDTVSAATSAALSGGALVLTRGSTMNEEVRAYLSTLPVTMMKTAVGADAKGTFPSTFGPIVGSDEYVTSALVASRHLSVPSNVGVASAAKIQEGIAGAAYMASVGEPLVVTESGKLSEAAAWHLSDNSAPLTGVTVIGDSAAVSDSSAQQAAAAATQQVTVEDTLTPGETVPSDADAFLDSLVIMPSYSQDPTPLQARGPVAAFGNPYYEYQGLNDAEKSYCRWPSRWNICSKAGEDSSRALSATERHAREGVFSEQSQYQGGGDAFRHCYWSGLMALHMGVDKSKEFGDRHEHSSGDDPRLTPEQRRADHEMDYFNNATGRYFAYEVKRANTNNSMSEKELAVETFCMISVNDGYLHTIT